MVFLIRIVVKAKMPRTGLACGHLETWNSMGTMENPDSSQHHPLLIPVASTDRFCPHRTPKVGRERDGGRVGETRSTYWQVPAKDIVTIPPHPRGSRAPWGTGMMRA